MLLHGLTFAYRLKVLEEQGGEVQVQVQVQVRWRLKEKEEELEEEEEMTRAYFRRVRFSETWPVPIGVARGPEKRRQRRGKGVEAKKGQEQRKPESKERKAREGKERKGKGRKGTRT